VLLVCLQEHLGLSDVTAVGVGCPGVVHDSSIVHTGGALNWGVVPLRQLFEDKLGKAVGEGHAERRWCWG
jgi:predicted NBD/HSP70 family sugar kinase